MAGLMLATTCTGCYSAWDISPRALTSLNGYRAPQTVKIADDHGEEVAFDPETELRFYGPDGELQDKAKFASIDVKDSMFTGVARAEPDEGGTLDPWDASMLSVVRDGRRTLSVELSRTTRISKVQARKFSLGKTIAVSVGVPAGVAAVATLAIFVAGWGSMLH